MSAAVGFSAAAQFDLAGKVAVITGGRERTGHLPPETARAAGDDSHLAGQIEMSRSRESNGGAHPADPKPDRLRAARRLSMPMCSPRLAIRSSLLSPRT